MSDSSSRAILTINAGSSSIKFAIFEAGSLRRTLHGQITGIGGRESALVATRGDASPADRTDIGETDHGRAAETLIRWLEEKSLLGVAAIGHRIVHGGIHQIDHQRITPALVCELEKSRDLDPAHLPQEIALIKALARSLSGIPQLACFDTAFHRDLPRVAQLLPIPRHYIESGIRRLGFHGLSYTYLLGELKRVAGSAAAEGRVILAHLGSGASLAAVHRGKPVDTSMGFTPAAGLVMSQRPGDLDPGLLIHVMRLEGCSPDAMDELIHSQCGLRGVSGTTGDMRELLSRRGDDSRAADAVDLFCYQARKWIGAFAATLGGLDTVVFSGGIGERSAIIRREICAGLQFLNLVIDEERNQENASVISADRSAVTVRVMATDEELVIARAVTAMLEGR